LSYVPAFGWVCLLAGHITIDPSDQQSKRNAIKQSEKKLKEGSSILFYPEGTRGYDPKGLLSFKTGAFRVAYSTHKSIIPITLIGTKKACNRGICDVGTIVIVIDKQILTSYDINKTVDQVRILMLDNLNQP